MIEFGKYTVKHYEKAMQNGKLYRLFVLGELARIIFKQDKSERWFPTFSQENTARQCRAEVAKTRWFWKSTLKCILKIRISGLFRTAWHIKKQSG
ncbi:MAG: hypothetical protein BWY15_01740 [Firmicutes bacterium ADurb.Bin193]|nr:MAG: hypothetical protein BWY15_01740 [Firmicutes bacterium ADurb.Bin193]